MKKIYLLINDIHLPGGTERATINLAGVLNNQGYEVEILSLYSSIGPGNIKVSGVAIRNFNLPQTQNFLYRQINLSNMLWNIKIPCGSVLIATNVGINTGMALIGRMRGWKTVGCEHLVYDATSRLNKIIRKVTYKWLSRVVVLTQQDKKHYEKDGIKASIIPNMLPFYPETPYTPNLESKKLLAVGRLTSGKGFDTIIPLIAPLLRRYPDWQLDIVGEGELRQKMEGQIRSTLMEEHIHLLGISNNIEEDYSRASIFLLTSRNEAFGMVLVEAKAFGLPVVAYDAPHGPRDIVKEGVDGFLVPLDNATAFLEKTELLMSRPELWQSFSTQARENVRVYLPERVTPLWINLIENL